MTGPIFDPRHEAQRRYLDQARAAFLGLVVGLSVGLVVGHQLRPLHLAPTSCAPR